MLSTVNFSNLETVVNTGRLHTVSTNRNFILQSKNLRNSAIQLNNVYINYQSKIESNIKYTNLTVHKDSYNKLFNVGIKNLYTIKTGTLSNENYKELLSKFIKRLSSLYNINNEYKVSDDLRLAFKDFKSQFVLAIDSFNNIILGNNNSIFVFKL